MCDLEFIGFTPDEYLEAYAEAMMRRVFEQTPYHSVHQASLERTGSDYLAKMTLELQDGSVSEKAVALDPKEALESVEQRIYEQLNQWHRSRIRMAA